ncbi:MAG TPA: xanthine dehydrogenase small subunit [Casimicrobiaceae bacterium]|nr:xanthine dehydrogenase small subunit [Casimicrobiaceae bacterium]
MAARQRTPVNGDAIRFVLDGEIRTVEGVSPTRTVLNFLREDLGRTGTKEGCAEGDCGACTVVLAELAGSDVRFRAVNSCIQFVPTLDGKELITVESLRGPDGALHPVQRALVDCHGSQCGFCTPGFVMSLFALYKTKQNPTRAEIGDALAGNLCRCTGYRPIVDAGRKMYEYAAEGQDRHQHWMNCSFSMASDREITQSEREMIERLRAIRRGKMLVVRHGAATFYAPTTLKELAEARAENPDARMLAGATDVGLWVTKQHKDLPTIIYVGDVAELKTIRTTEAGIDIGAGASLTDAYDALVGAYPELGELYRRFASPPIRNAGTLGGNIANGSPIGDSMPVLMVLGTTLVLGKGRHSREIALDEFYLGYQKTALEPGEFVERVRVPRRETSWQLRTYKISKRFDQDISAVCGAFRLTLERGKIAEARVAFGGMAATPKRAAAAERALAGREWSEATARAAMAALDRDFSPITDMRASAAYRRSVARNLLYKFYLETSGQKAPTQVVEFAI